MKSKLFWPILILSVVVMAESLSLISSSQTTNKKDNFLSKTPLIKEEVINQNIIDFSWSNDKADKPILIMTANKKVMIDAIDLYVAYKGVIVNLVKNLNELPEPTFSKISTGKSLVVMNYLINDAEGFNIEKGQSIKVAQFDIKIDPTKTAELSIDQKTQVVETGTVKVLPFSSKNLIINGSL